MVGGNDADGMGCRDSVFLFFCENFALGVIRIYEYLVRLVVMGLKQLEL